MKGPQSFGAKISGFMPGDPRSGYSSRDVGGQAEGFLRVLYILAFHPFSFATSGVHIRGTIRLLGRVRVLLSYFSPHKSILASLPPVQYRQYQSLNHTYLKFTQNMPPATRNQIASGTSTAMPSLLSNPFHEQVDMAATHLGGADHNSAPELTNKICKLFLSNHPGRNRSWNSSTQHNIQANMTFDDEDGEVRRCVIQEIKWKPQHVGEEVGLCNVSVR